MKCDNRSRLTFHFRTSDIPGGKLVISIGGYNIVTIAIMQNYLILN